jgi:hypothetical protein
MATIRALEARKGIPNPTSSKAIEGEWKLLYTTTTNTASPIQRSFVGNKQFSVVQDIRFFDLGDSFVKGGLPCYPSNAYTLRCAVTDTPTVSNIVRFGENIGQLRVTAVASTGAKPLPGFTPRQGDGRILGLNVFGVSSNSQSQRKFSRIDFQFVDAAFEFTFLPFTIPYPVPFRILGDEAKGWIDITYLSPMLRVARGNKGTTFVLQKQ